MKNALKPYLTQASGRNFIEMTNFNIKGQLR